MKWKTQMYALRQLSALDIPQTLMENVSVQGLDTSSPKWFIPRLTFKALKFSSYLNSETCSFLYLLCTRGAVQTGQVKSYFLYNTSFCGGNVTQMFWSFLSMWWLRYWLVCWEEKYLSCKKHRGKSCLVQMIQKVNVWPKLRGTWK